MKWYLFGEDWLLQESQMDQIGICTKIQKPWELGDLVGYLCDWDYDQEKGMPVIGRADVPKPGGHWASFSELKYHQESALHAPLKYMEDAGPNATNF